MGIYSVLDDIDFLKREFPELLPDSVKPAPFYECRICSEQFSSRKLLEAHKKLSLLLLVLPFCFEELK